jgi:hypothetical protein
VPKASFTVTVLLGEAQCDRREAVCSLDLLLQCISEALQLQHFLLTLSFEVYRWCALFLQMARTRKDGRQDRPQKRLASKKSANKKASKKQGEATKDALAGN